MGPPFFRAAVRRHDTTCLLYVFPCVFLGYLFRVAPRRRPRVSGVCYLAKAFFVLSSLSLTSFLELDTPSAASS